jgi:hypothetical protein
MYGQVKAFALYGVEKLLSQTLGVRSAASYEVRSTMPCGTMSEFTFTTKPGLVVCAASANSRTVFASLTRSASVTPGFKRARSAAKVFPSTASRVATRRW